MSGRATWLFRNGYAEQAAMLLQQAAQKCGPELKKKLETVGKLAECFAEVDRFDFSKVCHKYGRYRDNLNLIFSHRNQLQVFQDLQKIAAHWEALKNEKSAGGAAVSATLHELLANAERRAKQGRYDDAVGRLYRATELFVQGKLFEAFQAKLGKVRQAQIPPGRIKEWAETFGAGQEGMYALGVKDGFTALAFSSNPAHHAIAGQYAEIANHLQRRNNSILAHGLQPCDKNSFTEFWNAVLPVVEVSDEEIPRWPEIDF